MPTIQIRGKEYPYQENEVIDFAEGLIGFPEMRRAVVVPMDEFEPFCWLVSIENESSRFVVVDPKQVFDHYDPPASSADRMLAIVKISSEWRNTTVNLRAPVVIDTETQSGSQLILSDTDYRFEEAIVGT